MKIGLGAYAFRWAIGTSCFKPTNPLTAAGLVAKARELAVDVVQFSELLPLVDLSPGELRKLSRFAQEAGIELEGGTKVETADIRSAVEHLLRYLEVAEVLGMRLVRLVMEGESPTDILSNGREILRRVIPHYIAGGVKLAVENHFKLSATEMIQLVTDYSREAVGVCLDTANSIGAGEWPKETVAKLAPYALSLHLKDYRILPHPDGVGLVVTGAPLGQGQQDLRWILSTVREKGLSPNVILELWLPREGDETAILNREQEWVEASVKVAKEILQEILERGQGC